MLGTEAAADSRLALLLAVPAAAAAARSHIARSPQVAALSQRRACRKRASSSFRALHCCFVFCHVPVNEEDDMLRMLLVSRSQMAITNLVHSKSVCLTAKYFVPCYRQKTCGPCVDLGL